MGIGYTLMDRLVRDHNVAYCQTCRDWVAGNKGLGGAITCCVCGSFVSPLPSPYNVDHMRKHME